MIHLCSVFSLRSSVLKLTVVFSRAVLAVVLTGGPVVVVVVVVVGRMVVLPVATFLPVGVGLVLERGAAAAV